MQLVDGLESDSFEVGIHGLSRGELEHAIEVRLRVDYFKGCDRHQVREEDCCVRG